MKYSCVPLGGLVTISGGGTPSRNNDAYWGGSIPWATVKDLKDTSLASTQETITLEGLRDSASNLIPAGSVIVATRMGLGKVAINTMDVTINQDLKAFSCGADLEPRYLMYYLLVNASHLDSMGKGATVKGITLDVLKDLSVPLPPLPEQKRIAAILDKADSIRRKRQEAVRLTEDLLRSVFLDMFGDPVTNPKGWETKRLGDLGHVVSGLQVSSKRAANLEVPYLRVANIYRDRLMLEVIKTIQISTVEFERARLSKGDLLIVEGHGNPEEIGRTAVWDGSIDPCVHQNHLIRVQIDHRQADSRFVSAYLNSSGGRQQLFKCGKTTSGLNTINTTNVKNTLILMPPLSLQQQYIRLVERILSFQGKMGKSSKQEDTLFNSLLLRAFMGEL